MVCKDFFLFCRPYTTFLQREHQNGQQTHENILNIMNHQGNSNQNLNEIHLTLTKMTIIRKTRDKQIMESMW